MKIAVVGATGMVGEVMLRVLAERNFPLSEFIPVASERSVGKTLEFRGEKIHDQVCKGSGGSKTGYCPVFCGRRNFSGVGARVC